MDEQEKKTFASPSEAADHYQVVCEELRLELEEYKATSAEIENELETELSQKESHVADLRRQCERMEKELGQTKDRLGMVTRETNDTITALQEELTALKRDHQQLLVNLRRLEQKHDDVERSERVYQSSLGDLEEKLEKVVERNAFLEYENNALEIELQHLREELRDSQTELAVLKNQPRPPTPQPLKLERQRTESEPPTLTMLGIGVGGEGESKPQPANEEAHSRPEMQNGRRQSGNALGLVNDILLRVMSLEKRLSSCRNFIQPQGLPEVNGLILDEGGLTLADMRLGSSTVTLKRSDSHGPQAGGGLKVSHTDTLGNGRGRLSPRKRHSTSALASMS